MTPATFALILLSVTLSAAGQTSFKTGVARVSVAEDASLIVKVASMLFSPWVLAGLSLYAFGTIIWLLVLRRIDLSLAYPFVAMSFILVALAAYFVLGEAPTPGRVVGLFLVVCGLCVIAYAG